MQLHLYGYALGDVNVDALACIKYAAAMKVTLLEDEITAWAQLIRVSQDLLSDAEGDMKSSGLPPLCWYDVLLELDRAGSGGLRPFQLQERMLLAQYNLSRLVDRLVKSDYVTRMRSAEDGRGQVLVITKMGKSMLKRMWPAYRTVISDRFADKLTKTEIQTLGRILGKLRN